jgi:hypothetical protein
MDFLKENLFYVILIAAVIVVSVPSYVLGSRRRETVRQAQSRADRTIEQLTRRANSVRIVPDETIEAAKVYREGVEGEKEKILAVLNRSDRHLDRQFLVDPAQPGALPDAEMYKQAYYAAFAELNSRIEKAGLRTTQESPLGKRDDWGVSRPSEFDIRVTQKKYWILKALVDIMTDPECGVLSVQSIKIDNVPNRPNVHNRPHASDMFWIYPMTLEFTIDFRKLPVFLDRLVNCEDVFFEVPGFMKMTRAFDETKAVYIPQVSLTFYFRAWDYISTKFERDNLAQYKRRGPGQGGGGGRR